MKTSISLNLYKITAIVLAVFSVLSPAFGTYADDYYNSYTDSTSDSSSNDYYNNYAGNSNDYYNSYTPSSSNYSYTPSYDYYTTDTTSGGNYSYSYATPYYYSGGYSGGYSYGYSGTPSYSKVTVNNSKPIAQAYSVSGSCAGFPSTAVVGQSVTWSANGSDGNGSYSYSWGGDVSGSGQSVTNTYSTPGTKNATVYISSGGSTGTRNCSIYVQNNTNYINGYNPYYNYYNNGSLSASCYSNITNPSVGQSIILNATVNGGNGNYSYLWGGDAYAGTSQSISQTFYSSGTKYITVQVYSNGQSTTANCSVNVGTNSNITVYGNTNNAGTGGLTSGVFLSQIPYTGLSGGWNVSLFILGLFFWSGIIAWFILRKKELNGKFSRSEMVERFKQQNLAQKLTSN